MAEKMIDRSDATMLRAEIMRFVKRLEGMGFDRDVSGVTMAGVGLALAHAGGFDIENIFEQCCLAVEQDAGGAAN